MIGLPKSIKKEDCMDNDTKTVAAFLGIDPADVERTATAATPEGAVVHLYTVPFGRECPDCHSQNAEAKGRKERILRHALFLSRPTLFVLHQRRYRCRECGRTFNEPSPFAAKNAKVTVETERIVLERLSSFDATFASVARETHLSDTAVMGIFDRRFNPGRSRLPKVLCIDECYGKGQFRKPYCLMLLDWTRSRLCDVLEGRDIRTMRSYFYAIPEQERLAVECVSIDMYEPYLEMAKSYFKKATVCVDSFHVMENLCRALDAVRRRVMNGFPTDSDQYHYLKKYARLLFVSGLDPFADRTKDRRLCAWLNGWEAVRKMREISPDIAFAHSYYLSYKEFNSRPRSAEEAERRLDALRTDASVAHIPEMAAFMQTVTNWRSYIANSFAYESGGRRISNGPVEGFNSQYKKLMRVSNGLSNFQRFRARLILCSRKEVVFSPPKKGMTRRRAGRKRGKYKRKGAQPNG